MTPRRMYWTDTDAASMLRACADYAELDDVEQGVDTARSRYADVEHSAAMQGGMCGLASTMGHNDVLAAMQCI